MGMVSCACISMRSNLWPVFTRNGGNPPGNADSARELRSWVRAQARDNGDLPEQVTGAAQFADEVEPWLERWGQVATPLLWSHAMFLISEAAA